jgi:dTDP-4-dehydrorhamnose reductase
MVSAHTPPHDLGMTEPLVIGASGLVGGAIYKRLVEVGSDPTGTYRTHEKPRLSPMDLAEPRALKHWEMEMNARLIVMASAMTHVDGCETDPAEAQLQNVEHTRKVVEWCRQWDRPLLFFSTDYVFDGAAGPYAEAAPTHPLSVYGRTKLEAEQLVLSLRRSAVIRITNVFDIGFDERNFVHRCVTSLRDRKPLVVPSDQFATPMYATWLAEQCVTLWVRGAILCPDSPKLLHAGCDDLVSRGELARRVASRLGADASLIEERPTASLGQLAPRPLRGGLRNDLWKRLLGVEHLPLDDALADCLPRMKELYARTH